MVLDKQQLVPKLIESYKDLSAGETLRQYAHTHTHRCRRGREGHIYQNRNSLPVSVRQPWLHHSAAERSSARF